MLGPVTQGLFDQLLCELNKENNQDRIKMALVDPLVAYIHAKIYTYLQFLGILMGLIIILLVIIVCLNVKR